MQLKEEHNYVQYKDNFVKKPKEIKQNKIMIQNAHVTFSVPNQHHKI